MKLRATLTTIILACCLALLSLSPVQIGSLINATVAAFTTIPLPKGAGICGVISAYTPATSSATGSIRIAGLTYTIAPNTVLPSLAVGQDRCFSFCFNANGQITGGDGFQGYNVSLVCGMVTDFSKSLGGVAGSVTIGGAKVRIAPGTFLNGQDQVAPGSNTCLVPFATGEMAGPSSYFLPSPTHKQVRIPTTVHGTIFGSSQDDVFNLPDPTILTLDSDQASVFQVGPQTFGRTVSAESSKIEGFSYSTPNSTLQAISCTESFWDIVMEIASRDITDGDMVTLNLLDSNKNVAQQIAMFTIQNGGAQVTKLHPDVKLLGNGMDTRGIGYFAPFVIFAGNSGTRTVPLTLVFSTSSPAFMGCFQLSVEVKRGGNIGTTTVVIENLVVKRMERPGDRNTSVALGLLTNLIGWYPTGKVCDFVCWQCTSTPTPTPPAGLSGYVYCDNNNNGIKESGELGLKDVVISLFDKDGNFIKNTTTNSDGAYNFPNLPAGTYTVIETQPSGVSDGKESAGNCYGLVENDKISGIVLAAGASCSDYNFGEICGVKCDTICWRATQFFITNIRYLPGGAILIPGVNANNPSGIQQSTDAIRSALQSPAGSIKREYVTAQLSMAYSGGTGSPVVFNAFWSALSCSGISFNPVTLSNGVTLTSSSLLDTLVTQTNLAIKENRSSDAAALAGIWALLNGRCG